MQEILPPQPERIVPSDRPAWTAARVLRWSVGTLTVAGLLGYILWGFNEFTSLRGVINLLTSRIVLVTMWVAGVLAALIVVKATALRRKLLVFAVSDVVWACALIYLDRAFPMQKPQTTIKETYPALPKPSDIHSDGSPLKSKPDDLDALVRKSRKEQNNRPPKVKQWTVTFEMPFRSGPEFGVPFPDAPLAPNGQRYIPPLYDTYALLADVCRVAPSYDEQTLNPRLSSDEPQSIASECLRYAIVRWVAEMQNPQSLMSYRGGVGAQVVTETAVPVPEAEQYPKQALEALLSETKFGSAQKRDHHWFWENENKFVFIVPTKTVVRVAPPFVTWSRNNLYKLSFETAFLYDVGVPPVGFRPIIKSATINYLAFRILERMEWYGEYENADPYMDWASALFAGLEKRLKQPSPTGAGT
jgi:hypothetical protein